MERVPPFFLGTVLAALGVDVRLMAGAAAWEFPPACVAACWTAAVGLAFVLLLPPQAASKAAADRDMPPAAPAPSRLLRLTALRAIAMVSSSLAQPALHRAEFGSTTE
jgi:hypothetical protein